MRTYHYRYPVRLEDQQRRFLEAMLHTSGTRAKHYLVARTLLMSESSEKREPSSTDEQKALALSISRRTVIRLKQRFVQENLGVALAGSFPRECPERRCLDGKGEAQLIHLACSKAPDGRQRWTLELLADQMVRLEYVEHSSPETVRKTLKKRTQAVAQKILVFSESEADANFFYHMEDVLDVYRQPYDPSLPRICMDEMGKNAGHQTNIPPNEASPGQVAREDYTRRGKKAARTCSLPMNRSLVSGF
jgi:hypothetical protein